LIGQNESLPVFAQALLPILADGMHGHGEKSEFHVILKKAFLRPVIAYNNFDFVKMYLFFRKV
jgi:hypothetical protein